MRFFKEDANPFSFAEGVCGRRGEPGPSLSLLVPSCWFAVFLSFFIPSSSLSTELVMERRRYSALPYLEYVQGQSLPLHVPPTSFSRFAHLLADLLTLWHAGSHDRHSVDDT